MYRLFIFLVINFVWLQSANALGYNKILHQHFSWSSLDFDFSETYSRQQAKNEGSFIPGAPVPIDVDYSNSNGNHRVFVTIPRFQAGVPATLGYLTDQSSEINPLIKPYPNWEMNKIKNCNSIISVYRVKVDECNRLWVLDTGNLIEEQICPPKLLLFDLFNDELISHYEFPKSQVYNDSLFITPVVDIRHHRCDEAFVYIADVTKYQLIVYDHRNKKSWNIQNEIFNANKIYSNFTIEGENFELMDGIFGLALGPIIYNDRILYFHSLASVTENYVPTSIIKNEYLFQENPNAMSNYFGTYQYNRPSQSASEAMSRHGILFYSLLSQTALACWNSINNITFNENTADVLIQNQKTLQFPSGLKVTSAHNSPEQVWLMTVRFQKIMTGTINPNEINFRIQSADVNELVRGTKCESQHNHHHHHSHHNHYHNHNKNDYPRHYSTH